MKNWCSSEEKRSNITTTTKKGSAYKLKHFWIKDVRVLLGGKSKEWILWKKSFFHKLYLTLNTKGIKTSPQLIHPNFTIDCQYILPISYILFFIFEYFLSFLLLCHSFSTRFKCFFNWNLFLFFVWGFSFKLCFVFTIFWP